MRTEASSSGASRPEAARPEASRPEAFRSLADLDRRIVPQLADRMSRLLVPGGSRASRSSSRLDLPRDVQRVLGGIALVLLLSAVALLVVGD